MPPKLNDYRRKLLGLEPMDRTTYIKRAPGLRSTSAMSGPRNDEFEVLIWAPNSKKEVWWKVTAYPSMLVSDLRDRLAKGTGVFATAFFHQGVELPMKDAIRETTVEAGSVIMMGRSTGQTGAGGRGRREGQSSSSGGGFSSMSYGGGTTGQRSWSPGRASSAMSSRAGTRSSTAKKSKKALKLEEELARANQAPWYHRKIVTPPVPLDLDMFPDKGQVGGPSSLTFKNQVTGLTEVKPMSAASSLMPLRVPGGISGGGGFYGDLGTDITTTTTSRNLMMEPLYSSSQRFNGGSPSPLPVVGITPLGLTGGAVGAAPGDVSMSYLSNSAYAF